ncbi:carbohydrate-binding domain-containing protein [Streptomyces sp. 049-1]|uniref:carbohydrate-binding domain-containing protein n=1 Tax=Streptomyces sp. 049-1 TaxID=2789264 RepID=UPI0039802BE6
MAAAGRRRVYGTAAEVRDYLHQLGRPLLQRQQRDRRHAVAGHRVRRRQRYGRYRANGYPYCVLGSASDPHGDGWGGENGRPCVVRGGAADR